MKLGIIRSRCTPEDFAYAKEKGLSFLEICMNYEKDAQAFLDRAAEIRALSRNSGVAVGSVGRWNAGPLDETGHIRPHLLEEARRCMDVATELNCPVYVCGCNWVEGLSLYQNYTAAIGFFSAILDHARPLGLRVAVYNCHWNNWIESPAQWEMVLGELPELMIKYDTSHSVAGGRDYLAEMRDWAPRFAHVHIKGYVQIGGQYVDAPPAGLDALDWPTIFAILYRHGYAGGLSIEPHSSTWRDELGEKGVDYTIRFIRRFLL